MVGQQGVPFLLYPGDKLVIDPDCEPHPGNIVLAHVGGRAVVRKMRILSEAPDGKPQQVALVPLNPDFPTHEVEFAAVVGVVVGLLATSRTSPNLATFPNHGAYSAAVHIVLDWSRYVKYRADVVKQRRGIQK